MEIPDESQPRDSMMHRLAMRNYERAICERVERYEPWVHRDEANLKKSACARPLRPASSRVAEKLVSPRILDRFGRVENARGIEERSTGNFPVRENATILSPLNIFSAIGSSSIQRSRLGKNLQTNQLSRKIFFGELTRIFAINNFLRDW